MSELSIVLIGIWACFSKTANHEDVIKLMIFTSMLCFLSFAATLLPRIFVENITILRIVLLLSEIEMVIAYSHGVTDYVFKCVLFGIIGFLIMYMVVKKSIYESTWFGRFSVIAMPVIVIFTRVFGRRVLGSYWIFNGILVIAPLILLLPFAMGFLLGNEINTRTVSTKLSRYQIGILMLVLVVGFGTGILNNEFSIAVILIGTAGIMLLAYEEKTKIKCIFFGIISIGVFLIALMSGSARERLTIVFDLESAMELYPQSAQPMEYIIDSLPRIGLFGVGLGTIPEGIYRNALDDYIFSTILFDGGFIFLLLVIGLIIVLIYNVFRINTVNVCDKIIVESFGVLLSLMLIFTLGGNLGSVPFMGVGFGFLSVSKSLNIAMYSLTGAIFAIQRKGEDYYDSSEDKSIYMVCSSSNNSVSHIN